MDQMIFLSVCLSVDRSVYLSVCLMYSPLIGRIPTQVMQYLCLESFISIFCFQFGEWETALVCEEQEGQITAANVKLNLKTSSVEKCTYPSKRWPKVGKIMNQRMWWILYCHQQHADTDLEISTTETIIKI